MSIAYTWVYLIHDPFTGFYKIGQSDDPKARLRELTKKPSTILPVPNDFTIYEAWFCPASKEHFFHKEFQVERRRGEWFELLPSDIDWIEEHLSEHKRLNAKTSLDMQVLVEKLCDFANTSKFYAWGMSIFLNMGFRKTGDYSFFSKQLTTSLPNDKWFDD